MFFVLKSISGIKSRLYIPPDERVFSFVATTILLQNPPDIIQSLLYYKWCVKSTFSYKFE